MVKEETLKDYIIRKAEWYIPADEAIELKLATRPNSSSLDTVAPQKRKDLLLAGLL